MFKHLGHILSFPHSHCGSASTSALKEESHEDISETWVGQWWWGRDYILPSPSYSLFHLNTKGAPQ